MLNVQVTADEAVELLFVDNVNDARVYLSLDGIDGVRDLFYFMFDLTLKGLVRLYGDGGRRLCLDQVTQEQFAVVAAKLRNAGIVCCLSVSPRADAPASPAIDIDNADVVDPAPLSAYSVTIRTRTHDMHITYELSSTTR